jgi:ABC-type transport system substrate-binding protein
MRTAIRKCALTVLMLYLISVLAGCGLGNLPDLLEHNLDRDTESEDEQKEKPVPVRGGELIIPIPVPDTLNPLLTRSRDMINFFGLIYEGLFEYDQNMKPGRALLNHGKWKKKADCGVFTCVKGLSFTTEVYSPGRMLYFPLLCCSREPGFFFSERISQ